MTRAEAISGAVLVVAPYDDAGVLLDKTDLTVEHVADPDAAIARIEGGDALDVVVLLPGIDDPVRVAQRLHSLDRAGAVIVVADPEGEQQVRHALSVAPFLDGDVTLARAGGALADRIVAAAGRTQERRDAASARKKRRETPPPLSARYLGTLLDSVPIGLVTLDASGSVVGWNKRAGTMLVVPEVEALGTSFAAFFSEEDAPRLAQVIDSLSGSGIEDDPVVFRRGQHAYEVTGARFAIRSGEAGTLLILQDVTKREAAEEELRLQKALSDAQADSAVAGIVVITLDGGLERANRRFSEIWGIEEQAMRSDPQGSSQQLLEQVEDPEAFMAGLEALIATGDGEYRDEVVLKDGRTIERFATHVRGVDGEIAGRIWFHSDITAHRREEEALRFLADATDLLSSSLDYATTLRRVAELAVPRIADRCTVDVADEVGEPDPELHRIGPFSMHVPIQVRDRVFGFINFAREDTARPYNPDDVQLAEELARRAAIAIDNSRVHAEMREIARTLQESLLPPHLPAVRGLELAARFRPAGAGMQVGGDFYDIFDTTADCWNIAVGDVCGKGAEAAALTALTRYTVRAAAMYESEPSGVLRVLNEALLRQRGDFRFTTLAFCILDLGPKPTLRVACGGHPRVLVLRADGSVEAIGGAGPLLGVVGDAEFTEETTTVGHGDAIVLYTDGLTDALAPESMLTEEDLLAALSGCQELSAGEISARLEQLALAGDSSRAPRDDIALVVAKLG